MPLKPAEQKVYHRDWYSRKYATEAEFRAAEAARKAAWFQRPEVQAKRRAKEKAYRKKKREQERQGRPKWFRESQWQAICQQVGFKPEAVKEPTGKRQKYPPAGKMIQMPKQSSRPRRKAA